ncbi:MAG: hypothetical protein ACXQS8_06170 [Candidatus Helarchaeales archaeon]
MNVKKVALISCLIIVLMIFNSYFSLNCTLVNGADDDVIMTGQCTSDIYNMYVAMKSNSQTFGSSNFSYTYLNQINDTELTNTTFTASKIDVTVKELKEKQYYLNTTDNVTGASFPVGEEQLDLSPTKMAQYVKFENLTLVSKIRFFVNYTINGILFYNIRWFVDFYHASDLDGNRVNHESHSITWFGTGGGWTAGWMEINYNEFFDPGEYYVVIKATGEGWVYQGSWNNNSWQIFDYGSVENNTGPSLFQNSSGWFNISNDDTADYIMNLQVTHYYDPDTLNVRVYINDEELEPLFIRDPTVYSYSAFKPILKGVVQYFLSEPPIQNITINVTTNGTIYIGTVDTSVRYIYLSNATGNFTLTRESIRWEIAYEKVNSSSQLTVCFVCPNDWLVDSIQDSRGIEILEYAILYSYIYMNESYDRPSTAVLVFDSGDGQTTFNYLVKFHSPNYISSPSITTQVPILGTMMTSYQYFVGDVIQFGFRLSGSRAVSDYSISYSLRNPLGVSIDIGDFSHSNGQFVSNLVQTALWLPGVYTLTVTWTDGSEVGYMEHSFALQVSPIWGELLIFMTIGLAGVVSYRIIRQRLKQRNWHKKLDYLFVMTKISGRPMYSYSFGGKIQDPTLISGFLSAISSFVKEAVRAKSEHLAVLDQHDKKIIIIPGEYSNVVIISDINLPIIRKRAMSFIKDFERQYRKFIEKWSGDTSIFKGAEQLVLKHFPVTMEDKLIRQIGIELMEIREKLETVQDPSEAISLIREVTELTSRHVDLVRDNYQKLLNEIMKLAQEKMN